MHVQWHQNRLDALKKQNQKYSQSYQEMTNCGLQFFSKMSSGWNVISTDISHSTPFKCPMRAMASKSHNCDLTNKSSPKGTINWPM